MKSFQQYLEEDFNSPKATQFVLPIGQTIHIPVFYESLAKRSFDLIKYMKSFDSSTARETLRNTGQFWRALIFNVSNKLHIFVWQGSVVHHSLCQALDKNVSLNKYPKLDFTKLYVMADDALLSSDNNYVFPIVYFSGNLKTNLSPGFIQKMISNYKIDELFKLDLKTVVELTK